MAVEFLDEPAVAPAANGNVAAGFDFVDEAPGEVASAADINNRLRDPNYLPTLAEFKIYDRARRNRTLGQRAADFADAASEGAAGVKDMVVGFGKGVVESFRDPEANDPLVSVVEGVARGTVRDAGLVRDVFDNVLETDEALETARQQFFTTKLTDWRGGAELRPAGTPGRYPDQATRQQWGREFEREIAPQFRYEKFIADRQDDLAASAQSGSRKSIITGEEAAINPGLAEGTSLVASPMAIVPFGKAMTPAKTITRAVAAKTLAGAGKTFEWVGEKAVQAGTLPERAAGAAARLVSGTDEAAAKATQTVAQGVAGVSFAPVKATGKTISAGGEAAEALGRSTAAGPSRYGVFDRIAKDSKAPEWLRRAASASRPLDPAAALTGAAVKGASEGAAIGTVLGAAADGEEGAAAGFGAGAAIGAGGGLAGRIIGAGRYNQGLQERDLAAWLASKSADEVANIANLKLSRDQALNLADTERLAKGASGDVEFRYVTDKDFSQLFGVGKGAQVVNGDRPVVFVNTGYKGGRSMFHETLHALDALEGFAPQRQQLNRVLFDQTLSDGQVVSKGIYSAADLAEFTSQYRSRLNEAARSEFDLLTPEERTARIMSEVRSESFANLVNGYSGGSSVLASRGIKRRVADALLLAEADSMLGKMRRSLESVGVKFNASGDPSELFVKNGRPITNTPAVDAALRDYVRAKDNITRKLMAGDDGETPQLVVRPQDLLSKGNAGLVDTFKDSDVFAKTPDGKVKMMGGVPVLLSEREIRLVQSRRVNAMIDALTRVPNLGEADTVRLKPNGAWEGRTFSDRQLAAFDALPDDVLSPAMKAKLRQLNDLARQDGQQIILDYNAALKGGKYSSGIAPSTRAAVPLTFNISQAGNFFMTTLDTTHFFRKLGQWRKSKPRAFDAWNGDVDAFLRDAFTYLDNHVNGRSGAVNLDSDAAVAVHKKNVINDFFNVPKGAGNEDANPAQLSQRGDKDNLIRSRRFDRINRITPGAGDKFPIRYELQKANYLPESEGVTARTTPVLPSKGKPLVEEAVKDANGNGNLVTRLYGTNGGAIEWNWDARPHEYPFIRQSDSSKKGTGKTLYLEALKHVKDNGQKGLSTNKQFKDEFGEIEAGPTDEAVGVQNSLRDRGLITIEEQDQWRLLTITPAGEAALKANTSPKAGVARNQGKAENIRYVDVANKQTSRIADAATKPESANPVKPANFLPAAETPKTGAGAQVSAPNVSPVAVHKQLRAQAEFDLAQKSPGPANLNQWLASAYLDVLDKKLNRGSTLTRTEQLQRVKAIADSTTPAEMATAFAALLTGGQTGAKQHLERMAAMKALEVSVRK